MIVDVPLRAKPLDPHLQEVLGEIYGSHEVQRLRKGFYIKRGWAFDDYIDCVVISEWPSQDVAEDMKKEFGLEKALNYLCDENRAPDYGVCDSPEQFYRKYGKQLVNDVRQYCVCFCEIRREDQSEWGGWRYHKWGPYIGTQKPQHEYLYDDKHIEKVYTWHIYQVDINKERCVRCKKEARHEREFAEGTFKICTDCLYFFTQQLRKEKRKKVK